MCKPEFVFLQGKYFGRVKIVSWLSMRSWLTWLWMKSVLMPCPRIRVLAKVKWHYKSRLYENCPIPWDACASLPVAQKTPYKKGANEQKSSRSNLICPRVLPRGSSRNKPDVGFHEEWTRPRTHDSICHPAILAQACMHQTLNRTHCPGRRSPGSSRSVRAKVNTASEKDMQSTSPLKTPETTRKTVSKLQNFLLTFNIETDYCSLLEHQVRWLVYLCLGNLFAKNTALMLKFLSMLWDAHTGGGMGGAGACPPSCSHSRTKPEFTGGPPHYVSQSFSFPCSLLFSFLLSLTFPFCQGHTEFL